MMKNKHMKRLLKKAIKSACDYLNEEATDQQICDFVNSGKLDVN